MATITCYLSFMGRVITTRDLGLLGSRSRSQ